MLAVARPRCSASECKGADGSQSIGSPKSSPANFRAAQSRKNSPSLSNWAIAGRSCSIARPVGGHAQRPHPRVRRRGGDIPCQRRRGVMRSPPSDRPRLGHSCLCAAKPRPEVPRNFAWLGSSRTASSSRAMAASRSPFSSDCLAWWKSRSARSSASAGAVAAAHTTITAAASLKHPWLPELHWCHYPLRGPTGQPRNCPSEASVCRCLDRPWPLIMAARVFENHLSTTASASV